MKPNELLLFPDIAHFREGIELGETYRLDAGNLPQIIKKISAIDGINLILRAAGIGIYGTSSLLSGTGHPPIGMLVTGYHIKRSPTNLYLLTFEQEEKNGKIQQGNLVDLLLDMIE